MKMRILFILLITFLVSACSGDNESMLGFWVEPSSGRLAEFTETKVIFSSALNNEPPSIVDYEKIDSNRLHIKGDTVDDSFVINVNWPSESFPVPVFFANGSEIRFIKAANINPNEILGTWYRYIKNEDNETSVIITQKMSSSDLEILFIDHINKTYEKYNLQDVKSSFRNGFITESSTPGSPDETNYSYLISYSKNALTFILKSGKNVTLERVENPKHIDIPKGYKPVI